MRALVFLLVLGLVYKWPIFGDDPGTWSALFQGVMLGAIACTVATPSGWKAMRRIKGRLDGSHPSPGR